MTVTEFPSQLAALEEFIGDLPVDVARPSLIPPEVSWQPEELARLYNNEPSISRLKRWTGRVVLFGTLTAAGAGVAGTTAALISPSKTALGPIPQNEITPTLDNTLTVKIVPGLSIVKPLDGGQGIGAKIDVQEPPDFNNLDGQTAVYGGLTSDSEHNIAEVRHAVWEHWKGWAEFGGLATLALTSGAYLALGATRRQELAERFTPGRRRLAALSAGLLLFSINPYDDGGAAKVRAAAADPIFDHTPFEGGHFSGTLSNPAHEGVGRVLDYIRLTNSSYEPLMPAYQQEVKTRPLLHAAPDMLTTMTVANLHCNVSMFPLIRQLAHDVHPDFVVVSADTVFGGVPILDRACTDSLAYYLEDQTVVITDGNHTDSDLADLERQKGWIVLNGNVAEVAGYKVLGAPDQRLSKFGEPTSPDNSKNQTLGQTLAEQACAAGGVDLMIGATTDAVEPALQSGCVRLGGIAGDREDGVKWIQTKTGAWIPEEKGFNTGGVVNGRATVGPLGMNATIGIDQLSPGIEALRRQMPTYMPSGAASIGRIEVDLPPAA